jgi:hypothetical protein
MEHLLKINILCFYFNLNVHLFCKCDYHSSEIKAHLSVSQPFVVTWLSLHTARRIRFYYSSYSVLTVLEKVMKMLPFHIYHTDTIKITKYQTGIQDTKFSGHIIG